MNQIFNPYPSRTARQRAPWRWLGQLTYVIVLPFALYGGVSAARDIVAAVTAAPVDGKSWRLKEAERIAAFDYGPLTASTAEQDAQDLAGLNRRIKEKSAMLALYRDMTFVRGDERLEASIAQECADIEATIKALESRKGRLQARIAQRNGGNA